MLYNIDSPTQCARNPPENIQPSGIFPRLNIHEVRLRYFSAPREFSLTKAKLSPEFGNSSPDSSARAILHSLALKLQALPQRAQLFGRERIFKELNRDTSLVVSGNPKALLLGGLYCKSIRHNSQLIFFVVDVVLGKFVAIGAAVLVGFLQELVHVVIVAPKFHFGHSIAHQVA